MSDLLFSLSQHLKELNQENEVATTIKKLSFRIKNSLIIGMIDQLVGFEFQFIPAEFRILLGSVGISQLNEAITDRNVRGELLGDSPATLWEREAVLPGIGLNHFDIFRAKNIKQGIIDEIKNQFDFQFIEQKRQANNSGQNSATAHNLSESEQKLIWQDLQGQISDFLETIPKSRLSSFKFNNIEKDLKKIEKRSNGSNFNNGFWTQTWKKLNSPIGKLIQGRNTIEHQRSEWENFLMNFETSTPFVRRLRYLRENVIGHPQ